MSKKAPASVEAKKVQAKIGTGYPAGFDQHCRQRQKRVLGDLLGLTQFGVNLTTLPPGQWSALRHWHANEDEFVYIVEGEVVLITDEGEQVLKTGMSAGFAAGVENSHHLVNKSDEPASFLEVGTRAATEKGVYPDDDLLAFKDGDGFTFTNRKGEPY